MADDVCSVDAYSSSDASTSSSFTSASTGDSQTCEPPPPASRPCDIDDIILNAFANTRQRSYRLAGGRFTPETVSPGTRAISLRGVDGGAPRQRQLEVVGDRRGSAAVTRIRVMVHPLAAHDSSHVLVTVDRPGQADLVRRCPSDTNFDFEVYRAGSDSVLGYIFERFFTLHLDPARYRISVDSCGIRNSGRPVGSGHVDVLVYPYDQYTLTLTVPPIGRRSYARSSSRSVTGTTRTGTERTGAGGTARSESTTTERDGTVTRERSSTSEGYTISRRDSSTPLGDGSTLDVGTLVAEEADPDSPSLELKKNGAAEDVSANITAIIRVLSNVERAISDLRTFIRNMVPQVGFRFEASISFMQGSLSMTWGWKEHTDHQVYFGWAASISMWIFKIGLTLSFGISAGPATIRVLGEINDAGLNVTTTWDLRRPGRPVLPPTARGLLTIPLEVRGEAVLDMYVTRLSAAAGVRSGFNVEGGSRLNSSLNVEMYASVVWTGLDAFVRTEAPGEGTSEDVYHLIDQSEIYTGTVPI